MGKREELQEKFGVILDSFADNCAALISPRFGKTRMILNYVAHGNVLVCYPNVPIQKSWSSEQEKWGSDSNITYSTFASLKKLKDSEFDIIIIDEFQKLSLSQWKALFYIKGKKVFITGTISDKTKQYLDFARVPIIINYPLNQAIEDGVVTDFRLYIHYCELDENLKAPYNLLTAQIEEILEQGVSLGLQQRLKILSLKRMRLLHRSENKLKLLKDLIARYEHKRLLVFTSETFLSDQLPLPAFHSKNPDKALKERFCNGEGSLCVLKMFDTSVTIIPIDLSIIHNFSSNPETFAQQLNRVTGYEYNTPNKMAEVHALCIRGTQEEKWLGRASKFIPPEKIIWT